MTILFTAQFRYGGPDRVDVTTRRQHPVGAAFAPSWTTMVAPFREGRISWEQYSERYNAFLRTVPATAVNWVLSQPEVTFVCFCPKVELCHRSLLAAYFQTMYPRSCRYAGERIPQGRW